MSTIGQKLIPVMTIEAIIIIGLCVGFVMELISLPILIAGMIVVSSFTAFFVMSLAKQVRQGDTSPVDQDRSNEAMER